MSLHKISTENPEQSAISWAEKSEFKTWIPDKWNREKPKKTEKESWSLSSQ